MELILFFGVAAFFLILSARDIAIVRDAGNAQKEQNFVTFVSESRTFSTLALQHTGAAERCFKKAEKGRYTIIPPVDYVVVGSSEITIEPEQTQQITLVNQENQHLFVVVKGAK